MGWFTTAALLGTMHALASLYWAAGGQWLVDTVGQWAVDWRHDAPLGAGLALLGIGVVKLIAAWLLWWDARRHLPRRAHRMVRGIAWVGAALLVGYGATYAIAANVALVRGASPSADLVALRGHAWLWDPLFALWGLALVVALRRSRTSR